MVARDFESSQNKEIAVIMGLLLSTNQYWVIF